MRAIVLTFFCFIGIGTTLYAPYLGVLMWHWLSIMNPHRYTYGFTAGLPIIMMSAAVTLLMWMVSQEPKKLPSSPPVYILILFIIWVSFTTLFASSPLAFDKWVEVIKIMGMTLVTICATTTRMRLVALAWVTAISIGFWGVKGGIYSILKAGSARIVGPDSTFMADNNAFGLALLMALPLWLFLAEVSTPRKAKLAFMGVAGLIVIATLMTYSRGAALGLGAIGTLIWWSSRRRVLTAVLFVIVVSVGMKVLPEQWFSRMDTINKYEEDQSATGRLDHWAASIQMAKDRPITGWGFKAFVDTELARTYRPHLVGGRLEEAHSIYFQILGEQGYVGLSIFLTLGALFIWTSYSVYRSTKRKPELFWAHRLGRALMLSGIAFAVSGTFLSQAYFDFYYLLIAMTICLKRIVTHGDAPPRVDNFPRLLQAVRINTAAYGFEAPKVPAGQASPVPVPAFSRG